MTLESSLAAVSKTLSETIDQSRTEGAAREAERAEIASLEREVGELEDQGAQWEEKAEAAEEQVLLNLVGAYMSYIILLLGVVSRCSKFGNA